MLLGIKDKKTVFWRHFSVAIFSGILFYIFWLSRPEWSFDMRLWRAFGDASFMLLFFTLILGPLAKLYQWGNPILSWRRELGIWFGITALTHGILVIDGWARWSVMKFLGYEFIPQLERYAQVEPGFGLANLIGLLALFFTIILVATSFDKVVNFLGVSSWKWLHYLAYIIFYLVAMHVAYFLFMHFALSGHRPAPDPNWFAIPFVILALSVFFLQVAAFVKTVRQQRKSDWC